MNISGYNFLNKLLHKIVLGSKTISEISLEIEKAIYSSGDSSKYTDERHVFVSGLARSGTTYLMRCLYDTNCFASLTYSDMPFILAPNLWHKLSFGKSNLDYKERAHNDGILINSESPEAFDEVFWKVFLNDNYIQQDKLIINKIPIDIINLYENFVNLIIKKNYKGSKLAYLSKNNNNILRFRSILEKLPKSFMIVPFRDPLQHSLSLLAQHQHFCEIHKNDTFALKYMNWIGHYEFGLNQKPFYLNNDSIFIQMSEYNKNNINYWLLTWLNYYSHIFDNYLDSCILFSYELFCNEPNKVMNQLLTKIGLPEINYKLIPFNSKKRTTNDANAKILWECKSVYNKLLQFKFQPV